MKYVLGVYLPGLILGGAAFAYSVMSGLWPFVIIAWALISGLGVAIGFHRIYSHKTHALKPWLDNFILACGTLGGQGSSISWTAVHRGYHHRFSDSEKDLHSPVAHGRWHAFFGWYWNLNEATINHKYAVDLFRLKNHVWAHKHYFKIIYGFVILTAIIYPPLTIVYMSALFLSLLQDNLVNVLCHEKNLGYRNFAIADQSNNFWLLGYLGWGQGWHNNHHKHPARFNFGVNWWEFDPARLWLPLLKLGSTERQSS